jgi:antibiotic biosynthesis monooxygenase (ABM) superfamily enzyme
MIMRIWRGWTTTANAATYEGLLRSEIVPGILARNVPGFLGIALVRREIGDEVEFATLMRFASLEAVKEFAGEDHEVAVVPEKARAVLKRFDERSQHYREIISFPA